MLNCQVGHFLARDASLDQERIHALSGQIFEYWIQRFSRLGDER